MLAFIVSFLIPSFLLILLLFVCYIQITIKAVSYTHLDVYKRQDKAFVSYLFIQGTEIKHLILRCLHDH